MIRLMVTTLSRNDLFADLSAGALRFLAVRAHLTTVSSGGRLLLQDEYGRRAHLIVRGHVRVQREHPQLHTAFTMLECGPGDLIGEAGILDGAPCPDTATAIDEIDEAETLAFSAETLALLVLRFPDETSALYHALSRRPRRIGATRTSGKTGRGTEDGSR
jgi:CRP-like cAMP-binding protein